MRQADAIPLAQRLGDTIAMACQVLRGRRLPWLAGAFGGGVGLYFALPAEPLPTQVLGCLALAFLLAGAAWIWRGGAGLLPLVALCVVLGLLSGVLRTAVVAGPVLPFRYYGAVEGRVVIVDRSASERMRVTLDQVRLDGVPPDQTPRRIRVSFPPDTPKPAPGTWAMTTAHLSAPNGPTEPGGFDFQRHAWFLKLGAIGYTRVALLETAPPENGARLAISRLRASLSEGLRARLPGARGEVAAAITTGDRSGLPPDVVEALRASNLAHLLAISGLHMGLLVGFVFWVARGGLALWPSVALRYPTRAWAAAIAFPFALFYLFLSGGSVATQRAFVMAAVMLGAILLGRRALSLRSVALAAVIILAWRPESLPGPGFQMSFAATTALVIAFRGLMTLRQRDGWEAWFTGWRGALLSLFVSSLVAGLATAPFAALHFNRVGQFGLIANLLAVPMMGMVVMPLLLLGLILWPLGLEAGLLWVAGQGITWIIFVATWVADLPGAVSHVPAPSPLVLPLLGVGMTIVACAVGRGRFIGMAVLGLAGGLWLQSPRPDLLIASDGRLVGAMTPDGRHLSREKGAGFTAENWLENDGDPVAQAQAAARDGGLSGLPQILALRGKTGLPEAMSKCTSSIWVVTPVAVQDVPRGCVLFDETRLRTTGSVAVTVADNEHAKPYTVVTASDLQGLRPWTVAGRDMGYGPVTLPLSRYIVGD
ncbi:hypothetical protein JANAI62_26150 [Jannaschia pagri]|uniref:Competence protein ComEC n=1 Tax=Jannaschia pagri TaxID=2829797 RepID=A0ABQ4NNJ8_9RHOB|nr:MULTISPECIES: ComEC/Rec2 family competence protein [unclassified Jannaschia]GIT92157.1 hypothetical protein JANAI61_26150 [Jannaschia sp. AI_61]GIT95992.1 hypothetical protein JANAI62_26150 [Jannaschia sp. AI_62]